MDTKDDGPDPGDCEAWRQAFANQEIHQIRSQSLVAAAQQIGPFGDRRLLELLMKEIADRMMRILRRHIGRNHRNEGWDMIEAAHGQLIEAVLKPQSCDGSALRTAFVTTVKNRAADAIRRELLHLGRYPELEEDNAPRGHQKPLTENEESAHVESVLRRIRNPEKRLAFRLHLDGVPRGSKKVESIAVIIGVSVKTIETWIKETEEEVKAILGVKS